MGWALIPLHDVTSGVCSCAAGADCRSAGKHPRNKSWQTSGWVRDRATLELCSRDNDWNWGAVTGTPSGMWVLDVDLDTGGMESLRELAAACGSGPWLWAERVHRTGSDGLHLVFAIGEDGWMPRTGAGRIAPGLDVRAEGGQVVLPTSVSAKGVYEVELDGVPAVCAPVVRTEIERRLAPAPREPREVGQAADQGSASEAGDRYAAAVVETLLVEMRDAPIGTRNDTGFRTAVRLWELILAPWCSLDEDAVLERWWEAAGITGAPATELQGLWTRGYGRAAEAALRGEGAVLPASAVGGEVVPFAGGPAGPNVMAMTVEEYREHRATLPRELTAAEQVRADIEAALLPRSRFGTLKRPTYLIEDTINLASDTWLIGASGSYKSFVALDWACHVATGKPWRGKRVRQGVVVMVVAEGASGIEQRVQAWEKINGTTVGDELMMIPESVAASSGVTKGSFGERVSMRWAALEEVAGQLKPSMIILDTQARMASGLNENDNSDMGFWADCVASLKTASGACVLVVHHTGRKGGDARGASALDAAQDMEWTVTKTTARDEGAQRAATLGCTKNKDGDDRVSYALELDVIELGEDDEGKPITSLGVRATVEGAAAAGSVERTIGETAAGAPMAREVEPVLMSAQDARALAMYRATLETVPDVGATEAEIKALFRGLPSVAKMPRDTSRRLSNRAWNDLVALGLVMKQDGRERYRMVVLPNQSERGALTPNPISAGWMAPDGWSVVRPSLDAE